jgi:hypothetical protein
MGREATKNWQLFEKERKPEECSIEFDGPWKAVIENQVSGLSGRIELCSWIGDVGYNTAIL